MSVDDAAAGYRAAKESAAVFDLTGWTVLDLSGRDCVPFFNNFCTNDVKKLRPEEGCEAFVTNVKARSIGHVFVSMDSPLVRSGLTLIGAPGQGANLVAHLDRYVITEDVVIEDATADRGLLLVAGPQSLDRLREAGFELARATEVPKPGRFTSWPEQVQAAVCPVRRIDLLGAPGILIELPASYVPDLQERLNEAGLVAAGREVFDTLRIEACFPLYGVDVTEDHLAPEVGRPWAISYTKGCYLGQEPIARIDALGHVNRLLRGLRLESDAAPERGAAIVAEGKEIGAVTSAAISPADGRAVALGYVRAKFAEAGTAVAVRVDEKDVAATVFGVKED